MNVPGGGTVPLLAYDAMAMEIEVDLLTEWFYPAASGQKMTPDQRAEFFALWRAAFAKLDLSKPVLVLRDYHAENLMWLDDAKALRARACSISKTPSPARPPTTSSHCWKTPAATCPPRSPTP